jgi:hypothetical protein
MMCRAVEIDGVFHLWGHSWEIERFGQWENLDRVLRMMGELSPGALCLTNGELVNQTMIPAAIS